MPPGWLGAGHTVTPPQGMVDSGKLFLDACAVMTTVITKQLAPGLPIRPSPAGLECPLSHVHELVQHREGSG